LQLIEDKSAPLKARNLLIVLNGKIDKTGKMGGDPAKFLPKIRGLRYDLKHEEADLPSKKGRVVAGRSV
jgi:hypothetical protein